MVRKAGNAAARYGSSTWTMREYLLADGAKKTILPLWHSGAYPPERVQIFMNELQRVPSGRCPLVEADFEATMQERALLLAVDYLSLLEVERLLSNPAANPNVQGTNGVTALHTASGNGRNDVVEVLLRAGADVAAKDIASRPRAIYGSFGVASGQGLLQTPTAAAAICMGFRRCCPGSVCPS
ncbi:hypothetical protein TSOC_013456 [Tetrabaena socialis]|uniref:Uncharacterized protein n=1 Tax=Tetrabaena socialis TaxID=47790 RepID=A0A2J7ZKA3_9CHLO|nr:hypothetical protein TSOC_013456 [Tetrabaena socialis]|eukprot:PNH00706.1 hypothetical protein TSOC_013456 [Tetrabaena socialis]